MRNKGGTLCFSWTVQPRPLVRLTLLLYFGLNSQIILLNYCYFHPHFFLNKVFHKIGNKFYYNSWIPTKIIFKYKDWIGILKNSSSFFNNYSRIKISKINIPFFLKILLTKIFRVKKRLNFENECHKLPLVRPK